MNIRKAIIPAAGLGTRLYPLTRSIPKAMLPVGCKPMIQYAVEEAVASGIEEICIVVVPNCDSILDYFDINKARDGDDYLFDLLKSCDITFVEQSEQLGIADAISRARGFAGDDCFAIIVPDTLFFSETPGLKQVIDVFEKHQTYCCALVELSQIEELQRLGNYGFVEYEKLDEKAVKITKLYPKGQLPESFGIQNNRFLKTFGRSINKPELFEFIEEVREIQQPDAELDDVPVTQVLIQRVGRVGCILRGEGFDIGSLANYQSVCSCLQDSNFWSSRSQVDNEEGMLPIKAGRIGMVNTDSPTGTPTFNKQENVQDLCERLNKVKFSVVIPVFNEEENLEALHTRLTNVMEKLGEPYEIIFIDDGSKDGSFQTMKNLHQRDSNVKVIRLTRNFGQPAAKAAGFDFSEGDIVITIDADLEHPPEEITKLIDKLDGGYEVVYGVFPERKHSAFRRAGSAFSKWVLSKIVAASRTNISGFVAIRASAIERLNLCGEKTRFLTGLLSWTGASIGTVEVEHHRRQVGKSRYGVFRLLELWFDMVVSFTDLPLRLSSIGGLLLGIIGLLLGLAYLIRYLLYGFGVPGFATIVILLLVFFGFQFLYLGIIGEYLARVNTEVRNRPRYIIRDKLSTKQDDAESKREAY